MKFESMIGIDAVAKLFRILVAKSAVLSVSVSTYTEAEASAAVTVEAEIAGTG